VRIGIHLGDVMFSNNTVLGDGVNIASRIHALAPPGGICASASIYDEIRNKPGTRFKDLGEQKLKNVSRPIRVYQVVASDLMAQPEKPRGHGRRNALIVGAGAVILAGLALVFVRLRSPAPASPQTQSAAKRTIRSIAVLPLDNYSGDPNQEYFSDGMTDELTTDLATISALRVISRGSVMRYKGAHRPPTPEIAKALNVDAVVEGSVVRVGDKVRITAQLIDAPADRHLMGEELRARLSRCARAAGRTGVGDRERDQRATDTQRADAPDKRPARESPSARRLPERPILHQPV
jgi:adenylate cyclase